MKNFCLYILLGWFASLQCLCAEKEPVKDADIQKVYVIFKTHLDVGFTDWGSKVIDTYTYNFIPAVLNLSEEIMKDSLSQIDYPWTCGSWLIWNYLERASNENGQRMKEAIGRGDFTWHAMPFTMQVELCDSAMLSAALNISKNWICFWTENDCCKNNGCTRCHEGYFCLKAEWDSVVACRDKSGCSCGTISGDISLEEC